MRGSTPKKSPKRSSKPTSNFSRGGAGLSCAQLGGGQNSGAIMVVFSVLACTLLSALFALFYLSSSTPTEVSLPVSPRSVAMTILQGSLDFYKQHPDETTETVLEHSVLDHHMKTAHTNPQKRVPEPMLPFSEVRCDEDTDDCVCLARFLRYTETIKKITLNGQKHMKHVKAIIGGLVRDNEKTLEADVHFLHRLGKRFLDYRILLIENDSRDKTAQVMARICRHPKMICQMLQLHVPGSSFWGQLDFHRFATLAAIRNKGLDHIRGLVELRQLEDFDVVIWTEMDLTEHNDGLNPMFELDSIATSFGRGPFDLVCANGVIADGQFRDTLPLVSYEPEFREVPRGGVWVHNVHQLRDGTSFLEVETCFGGLGIYNLSSLLDTGCRYHPEHGVCEHLSLNRCLKEHGYRRMYINPTMIVYFEPFEPHRCIQVEP